MAGVCVPLTWLLALAGVCRAILVLLSIPLPDKETVVGLLLALLVRVSVPVRAPDAVGVKVTVTVQDAPTARVVQLLLCRKSPVVATPDTVAEVVPVLVTVTVRAAAEAPTTVPGKGSALGSEVRIGPGATPVPDSG